MIGTSAMFDLSCLHLRESDLSGDERQIDDLVRRDQLLSLRGSVAITQFIAIFCATLVTILAYKQGCGRQVAIWLVPFGVVTALRLVVSRFPVPDPHVAPSGRLGSASVLQQLRCHAALAFASGLLWSLLALMSSASTYAFFLFSIALVSGLSAGACITGMILPAVAFAFQLPVCLSTLVASVCWGGFEGGMFAMALALYHGYLARGSHRASEILINAMRLKYQAAAVARSREIARDEALHRARHDDLTGLLNRRGFTLEATELLRTASQPCLLLFDLDGFKSVNDTLGHAAGDIVLAEVAERLSAVLHHDVVLGRLGGDEFAAIYESLGAPPPREMGHQVIEAVGRPLAAFPEIRMGVSVGVCAQVGKRLDDMMLAADTALYAAKHMGRNRCHFSDDIGVSAIEMSRALERDIRRALATDELDVWYQPVFAGCGRHFEGVEALLRWRHPGFGDVPPPAIIAAAAASGHAEDLMRFILSRAVGMIRSLSERGYREARVSMNLSPRELAHLPADRIVLEELRRYDVPATMLDIELTEDVAIDFAAVREKLARLSQAGVSITLDDFGVGYSSLRAIRGIKVDRVKIDRVFIEESVPSIEVVVKLLQTMNLRVVIEGVETTEQAEALRRFPHVSLQGFYFARPAPGSTLLAWLTADKAVVAPARYSAA